MLEVKSIDVFRGSNHVLRNFSLEVGEAEVVCLVGRNGAGKTTALETIMSFLPTKVGKIGFRNEDMTRMPTHKRVGCGLGYSADDCGIFSKLSVGENLTMSLCSARSSPSRAVRAGRSIPVPQPLKPFPSWRIFNGDLVCI